MEIGPSSSNSNGPGNGSAGGFAPPSAIILIEAQRSSVGALWQFSMLAELFQRAHLAQRRQRGVDLDGLHVTFVGVFDRQRAHLAAGGQRIL
jgi:hypothetical protein